MEQLRIELILGLLHCEQGMRLRVVEQNEVGEHLDRSVRDVARDEGIPETAILKAQDQPPVHGWLRLDTAYTRHSLAHDMKYAVEAIAMVLVEVLCDLSDVVAASWEVLG